VPRLRAPYYGQVEIEVRLMRESGQDMPLIARADGRIVLASSPRVIGATTPTTADAGGGTDGYVRLRNLSARATA
jgi:hypothetical protein